MLERLVAAIWYGSGPLAAAGRATLVPASVVYRGAMAVRNELYRRRIFPSTGPAIPALSVGNLTVGGTGKTPVAAWLAAELQTMGERPAVVLRGYGGDEPLVHRRLHPEIPVLVGSDRVDGVRRAADLGATVAVLDDAFQHRRLRRDADVVLVSADTYAERRRLLPAGPWREPLSSLRRATVAVVTRKAASAHEAERAVAAVCAEAPRVPIAVVHLALGVLRRADADDEMATTGLAGRRVLAIAAIGEPRAFVRQLEAAGAVVRAAVFADHYGFDASDAVRLASSLADGETAVCTLKDAVKLALHWPRAAAPLWYVSQRLVVERGLEAIEAVLRTLPRARLRQP